MNMTSRLRWRICSAGFGATLMVGACSIIVRPPVITPEQLHPEWAASCRAIIDETRHRVITDAELAACVAIPAAGGNLEGMRAWERTLPPEPEPPRPTLVINWRLFSVIMCEICHSPPGLSVEKISRCEP